MSRLRQIWNICYIKKKSFGIAFKLEKYRI
nr:MAG TPA: hypothetical protein [Caudoviricetes sp.]